MFNKNEKRQTCFEETCAEIDVMIAAYQASEASEYSKPLWQVLLEEMDKRTQVFKRDKDGNIEKTKNNFPRVNWVKVLSNLPEIIAYLSKLLALIKAR